MTTVNSATQTSTSTSSSTAKNSIDQLGISDFIKLMTTQLQYQDPTQPKDATQYVSQLAQFSTVSGITEMNSSMSSLISQLKSSAALNATSLVGHSVLVDADSMATTSGTAVEGAIDTPSGASNLNVTVSDSSGQLVRHISVPVQDGLSTFTWDGLDDNGNAVASGTYSFAAIANVGGKSESATTLLASKVSSVTIDTTDNSLVLNTSALGSVQLADVRQVY